MVKIGLIGGSGFDDPELVSDAKSVKKGTPFGALSADLVTGKVGDLELVIISRHGKDHRVRPSAVNYRAHIWALKDEGVTHVIGTTACGSLREEIEPGHLVIPDQFIDMTRTRKSTFYEGDQVAHISHGRSLLRTLAKDPHPNRQRPKDHAPSFGNGSDHRGPEVLQ